MVERGGRAPRMVFLAALGTASLFGIWAAHGAGRDALGMVGGILVASVVALMLGAVLYVTGVVLFAPPGAGRDRGGMRRRREW